MSFSQLIGPGQVIKIQLYFQILILILFVQYYRQIHPSRPLISSRYEQSSTPLSVQNSPFGSRKLVRFKLQSRLLTRIFYKSSKSREPQSTLLVYSNYRDTLPFTRTREVNLVRSTLRTSSSLYRYLRRIKAVLSRVQFTILNVVLKLRKIALVYSRYSRVI